jgi:hypothetical protein
MQALRSSMATRAFAPAKPSSSSRSTVVVRAKPTSAVDYRTLSEVELITGVAALKAKYAQLQYMKRTRGKVQNPETLQVRARAGGVRLGQPLASWGERKSCVAARRLQPHSGVEAAFQSEICDGIAMALAAGRWEATGNGNRPCSSTRRRRRRPPLAAAAMWQCSGCMRLARCRL